MGNVLNGIKQKPFQGKIDYDYIMWMTVIKCLMLKCLNDY